MITSTEPWLRPRAAYVHLPFCAHHCGYCDFAVAVGRDDRRWAYVRALSQEMARLETPQHVDTLFFGGGTPTYFALDELKECVAAVRHWFPSTSGQEFSVEANPGTLDDDRLRVLLDAGLTRVSIGCQSFEPAVLRVLERDHVPADVGRAVERARRSDITVSLDLIFGVPGQTLEQWDRDLDRALELDPDGIATYGLTFEKGTRLWKQRREGQLTDLGEDLELAMYERAIDRLEAAGFVHYELSNFARPGKECRHNQVYWANNAHWGLGMGAAEYVDGVRRVNTRDLETYLRKTSAGESAVQTSETLPAIERAFETLGQNLRRREGVVRERFELQTGYSLDGLVGPALGRLRELELISDTRLSIVLTRRGKCVADSVVMELWKEKPVSDGEG